MEQKGYTVKELSVLLNKRINTITLAILQGRLNYISKSDDKRNKKYFFDSEPKIKSYDRLPKECFECLDREYKKNKNIARASRECGLSASHAYNYLKGKL